MFLVAHSLFLVTGLGDKAMVIDLYRQGIHELESGISIEIQVSSEDFEKAKRYNK